MEKDTRVRFEGRIPRPAAEVFDAIVNDAKMSDYFISRASGPLEAGRTVTWHFDDVGAELNILVLEVEEDKRIVFQWSASGTKARVEILLDQIGDETRVRISESGWPLDRAGVGQALGQMSGWTDFFNSLKAYLLFDVDLRRGIQLEKSGGFSAEDIAGDLAELDEGEERDAQGNSTGETMKTISLAIGGLTLGIALGAGGMYYAQPNSCAIPDTSLSQTPPARPGTTTEAVTPAPTSRPTPAPIPPAPAATTSGSSPAPAEPAQQATSSSADGTI